MDSIEGSITSGAQALGISGYTFADLHDPERLASLYDRFCEEVASADEPLWREWDGYRRDPDAPRPPIALSHLLVAMAPHLSRFVTRLFQVEPGAAAIAQSTHAEDDLFRFKVDFVRRRVLPLLKNGAHLQASLADNDVVDKMISGAAGADLELAVARAGCRLMDEEKGRQPPSADVLSHIESLKRWCAARLHDANFRHWVIFRFPETLDYWHLVDTEPVPGHPEAVYGPEAKLRRRDGFKLTDARMHPREVLSEIHYCVLCHERDKDSCSKGLYEPAGKDAPASRERKVSVNPLGIALDGCPLDEKISEMHMLRKAGDAIGALALVTIDNPMCPGTGHRICNDCMKSCIYQKQEPVNIPQIETGVLTDVLRMPWGVEIYGLLTRWNPLNVRRPYALPYNGKNVLVVGLGPAGYTLAHYLVNEGFGVVGIDGLKIEPLPEALVGIGRGCAAADPRLERHLSPARRTRARRLRRRFRVRHHRAMGQELSHAAASHARAATRVEDVRRRSIRRNGDDRGCLGLRVRSRGDRGRRRAADDHRHEEQPDSRDPEGERLPDGAAAHRRIQTRRAAESPGAASGGRDWRRADGDRHGHGADGVLPDPGRKNAGALRGAVSASR